jgi:hypothetical protein
MLARAAAVLLIAALLVPAQSNAPAGVYKGDWTGSGGNGDFRITIAAGGKAKIDFSFGGEPVACEMISFKLDGGKLEAVYDFELQGNKLRSLTLGTLKGKNFEGTYKTTVSGGDETVDQGTWKAAFVE